jgi:hypothetical protein
MFLGLFPQLLGLHNNLPGHPGMEPAVEWVFAGLRKAKFELVALIQRCRFEFFLVAFDGMGTIIMINPCDGRPSLTVRGTGLNA